MNVLRLADLLDTAHDWAQVVGKNDELVCIKCGCHQSIGGDTPPSCNGLDRDALLRGPWSEQEKEVIRRWFGANAI